LGYTAVSNVITRFSEKLEKKREIRSGVQEIMMDLSQVNGLTLLHFIMDLGFHIHIFDPNSV